MSWKDRRKSGNAAGLIDLDWDAIDRAVAELRGWKPKYIDAPVRFSSQKQEDGTSEARQIGNIEAFIKRLWSDLIPRWLKDLATSGYKYSAKTGLPHCLDEDKELGRYIAQAKRGEIPPETMLIVDNLDRFSRAKIDDSFDAAMTLLRNGITLLVLHPKPLLMRPEDRHNQEKRDVLSGDLNRSHNESDTRSRYVKRSFDERIAAAKAGEQINFGGQAPHYYLWDEDKEMYIPQETLFPLVQTAAVKASKNIAFAEIVRDLNDEDAPTLRDATRWTRITLYKLLHSECLLGTFTINNQSIPNYFKPPVVTQKQWDLIQARLNTPQARGGGIRPHARVWNLFPCRVFCFHCKMPMGTAAGWSFDGRHYYCKGHTEHATKTDDICGQSRSILVKAIELDLFGRLITKFLSELIEPRDSSRRDEEATLQVDIAKLEKQLRKAEDYYLENEDEARDVQLKARVEEIKDKIKPKRKRLLELASERRGEVGCEKALAEIIKRFTGIEASMLKSMDEAIIKLQEQLSDQALRRSVISPLKMIVARIDVDMRSSTQSRLDEKGDVVARYRVHLVGGAIMEWSDVTLLYRDLLIANLTASMTADRERRRKAAFIANGKANPLTPEQKKRHRDAMIKVGNDPAERAARSRRAKACRARIEKALALLPPEPLPPLPPGLNVNQQRMNNYWKRVRKALALLKQQEEQDGA